MKHTLYIVVAMLLTALTAQGQKKTFTRDYTYRASERDSKVTARAAAIQEMQTLLLMEIGQVLQSEQTLRKLSVTKDGKETFSESFSQEVMAITAGVVEMKIIKEEWNGNTYYIEAKMTVDPKEVSKRIAEILNEKQKVKEREDVLKQEREDRAKAEQARAEAEKKAREEQNKREQEQREAQKREAALKEELKREKDRNKNNATPKQAYQQQAEVLRKEERSKEQRVDALETTVFLNYRFSLTAPYGVLFGVCKRWGGYMQYSGSIGVRENYLKPAELYTYSMEDERRYFRRSFTAGGMVRPVRSWNFLYLYAGAGYGKYGATYEKKEKGVISASTSRYETENSEAHYYSPPLIKGLELEGGVTLSHGLLNVSMGYSTLAGVKVRELHFGLGFKFK